MSPATQVQSIKKTDKKRRAPRKSSIDYYALAALVVLTIPIATYPIEAWIGFKLLLNAIVSSTTPKVFFGVLLALNYKQFPLVWHLRLWIPTLSFLMRRAYNKKSEEFSNATRDPFYKVSVSEQVLFDDLDHYLHMNNASYLKIADFGLMKLTATLFHDIWATEKGFMHPIAGTYVQYLKPLNAFVRYKVHTSILTWDDKKWIYVQSRFVTSKKGEEQLHAVVIRKLCFKKGRVTINPAEILQRAELLAPSCPFAHGFTKDMPLAPHHVAALTIEKQREGNMEYLKDFVSV